MATDEILWNGVVVLTLKSRRRGNRIDKDGLKGPRQKVVYKVRT